MGIIVAYLLIVFLFYIAASCYVGKAVSKFMNVFEKEFPQESKKLLHPPVVLGIALEHSFLFPYNDQVVRLSKQNENSEILRTQATRAIRSYIIFALIIMPILFFILPLLYLSLSD